MKKLLKVEKWIIASSKNDVVYRCSEHGIFAKRKDVADGKCVRTNCNGIVEEVESPTPTVKKEEDKLSSSELDAMFGGWAK